VARRLHELLPTSDLFLLPGARHYVQMDEPQQVARLILTPPRQAAAAERDRDLGESGKRIEGGGPSGA
jgi:hypothetical protein